MTAREIVQFARLVRHVVHLERHGAPAVRGTIVDVVAGRAWLDITYTEPGHPEAERGVLKVPLGCIAIYADHGLAPAA